jgi:hypothetical protein
MTTVPTAPEPIVWPLDLPAVKARWVNDDVYGPLCGESRLRPSDHDRLLEGLRYARQDVRSLVAALEAITERGATS